MAENVEKDAPPIFVPGVFRCAKCNFTLVQSTLNARDGTVTARDAPGEKCPNDGSPMWRVTYAEQLAEAHEEWGKQIDRAIAAERQLDAIRAALAPVMHWYDGEPTDGDEHEPRELVDILTDVVSDLQADRASSLRLLAALRPFAHEADRWPVGHTPDETPMIAATGVAPGFEYRFTLGDLRKARAAVDGVDMDERVDV